MTTPFSKLRDTAMTDPAQPDEYAKLKAQKEAILLRQSPNKKLVSRLVELKELVENYHGVFPNRAVIAEALRDAAAALVSPPVQPVEATPRDGLPRTMSLAERIDAALERIKSGRAPMRIPVDETDVDVVLYDCKRALSLAQTENAGHIRIEDELKAALELAQRAINGALHVANEERARCAGLEKDAARYRWIERNLRVEHANEVYAKHCINVRNESSLEEAIDAAISAGKT